MTTTSYPVYEVFLPRYCALDCEQAASVIVEKAVEKHSFGVAALATHGLMESFYDPQLGEKINRMELIVPDGQAVVWALNLLHGLNLQFKIPGPTLTLEVLRLANERSLSVFLYGSTLDTLLKFKHFINHEFPQVNLVGIHEDRFREASPAEDAADVKRINDSGAHIVLVGRGCPRQEHWVADHIGKINAAMLGVGAAFDYHAGKLNRAPMWIQKAGLEWFYRLIQEPRRLWRRYLLTNSQFIYQLIRHKWLLNQKR